MDVCKHRMNIICITCMSTHMLTPNKYKITRTTKHNFAVVISIMFDI